MDDDDEYAAAAAANPPQKSVVIITLPAHDDPSQEKTITAFTISSSPQPDHHHHHHHSPPTRPPIASSSVRKPLVTLLSLAVPALLLWSWVSYKTTFDFLREEDGEQDGRKEERSSFMLPLYRKGGDDEDGRRMMREVGGVVVAGEDYRRSSGMGMGLGVKRWDRTVVNSSAVLPVNGNVFPDGIYYTIVHVGNPPKPYYLDVDTGSDLTWIQCDAPCSSCAKGPNPLYKPTKDKLVPSVDSLCHEVQSDWKNWYCRFCSQCDYEISYADHSSSIGVLTRDQLSLEMIGNDIISPSFVFGCAYDQQGQLLASPANTDGILGLGSSNVALPSQLASQNVISNVLGHCIAAKESTGGYLFLGDEFVPHWGMTWVPMLRSHLTFYQVEAHRLSYGAERIGGRKKFGHLVFDTGSSYSYFTNAAYDNLITLLHDSMDVLVLDDSDMTLPFCWKSSSSIRSVEDVKHFFKPLTFHFGSSWLFFLRELILWPEDYLIISTKGNVCLGILNGTDVYNGSFNILGDISMRGKLVIYDNNQQKIGWMDSSCSASQQKLKGLPFFF